MARKKQEKKTNVLPSGNVRIRVRVGRRSDGTIRYESFTAPTKDEAQLLASAFKIKARALLAAGVPVDAITKTGEIGRRQDTVLHYLDLYYDTCEAAGLSPSTLRTYKAYADGHYKDFRQLPADALTLPMVQEYINNRSKSGTSAKTIRNEINFLCAALKLVRPEINVRSLRMPKRERMEIQIPTTEEVQRMITAAKGTDLYIPLLLGALMGMRRSEICALTWKDVDVRRRTLDINKAMVRGSSGYQEKGTKTYAGSRQLAIPANVATALAASRGTDPRVTRLTPAAVTCAYERLLKTLGLSYRFHDLRHYHASVMIAAGVPEKYIVADMGHASMDMVNRVYGHVMEEHKTKINKQMEAQAAAFKL